MFDIAPPKGGTGYCIPFRFVSGVGYRLQKGLTKTDLVGLISKTERKQAETKLTGEII